MGELKITDEMKAKLRDAAREQYGVPGEVEIDDDAEVSFGEVAENGVYVAAWVWVEMSRYEVIVGNVGRVYDGYDKEDALSTFNVYVEKSRADSGRAAGEDVTLMVDGEIEREYLTCKGCGREEIECSKDPCPDVIKDRGEDEED